MELPSPSMETPPHEPQWQRLGKAVCRVGFSAGMLVGGGLVGLSTFGTAEGDVGPIRAEATLALNQGDAVLDLAPAGSVSFDVSNGPFGITARPTALNQDVDQIISAQSAQSNQVEDVAQDVVDDLQDLGKQAAIKGGLAFMFGASMGLIGSESVRHWVFNKQRGNKDVRRTLGAAVVLPITLAGGAGAWGAATYNEHYMEQPRYEGTVAQIADFTQSVLGARERYISASEQVDKWFGNLLASVANAEQLQLPSDNLVPVLLYGDTHSKPCAYDSAQTIIEQFQIPYFFNTGDETDQGLVLETEILGGNCQFDSMDDIAIEGSVVGGNHDGPNYTAIMDSYDNVAALTGEVQEVTIDGMALRVLGLSDPRYTPDVFNRPDADAERNLLDAQAAMLTRRIIAEKPDVVMVHDPYVIEKIHERLTDAGQEITFWAFSGHTHRVDVDNEEKRLNPGSFGGAGLRGLEDNNQNNESSSSQAMVVYFDRDTKTPEFLLVLSVDQRGNGAVATHDLRLETEQSRDNE